MEVSAEAKRIMVVALGKLYSSRLQRGGLRLHRSLLLTQVMKSARDIYHEAQTTTTVAPECKQQQQQIETSYVEPEGRGQPLTLPREEEEVVVVVSTTRNKENQYPSRHSQRSRKRRGKAAAEPDFLPCKKAKLEQGNCHPQLIVTPVLVDYVNCGGPGARPSPMTLHRATAACC